MKISVLQWNIGGGKIRNSNDDPMDPLVYCNDNLSSIIEILKKYQPDIITIQESHTNGTGSQAENIASVLGYRYFINDVYDESHLEEGQGLSQCIISKFPIEKQNFTLFYNPKFETTGPNGEHWTSHDKGISSCVIQLESSTLLNVKTSHSFPYRRFNIEPLSEITLPLRKDMAEKMQPENDIYIYQGDLNYNEYSIRDFLPNFIKDEIREVILDSPTTPKGRKYDHIAYKGLKHLNSKIVSDVLTDHYPIYSEFEI